MRALRSPARRHRCPPRHGRRRLPPRGDVALLLTDPREADPLATDVLSGIDETLIEGGDFIAFGYPDDGDDRPVGRLFKGHYQRYLGYTDRANRTYFAGELSVPAPSGLSGGPVVAPGSPDRLAGIVTTNIESYVVLDSVEEVERDGSKLRIENRRVVSYGIAALLTSHGPWLDAALTAALAAAPVVASPKPSPPVRVDVPVPAPAALHAGSELTA